MYDTVNLFLPAKGEIRHILGEEVAADDVARPETAHGARFLHELVF
jgi:hypothetical protein